MDTDRLNRWLTLVSNLAVVAGIIFLAVEIRQNNDILQAQARSSRTANVQSYNEMLMDPSIASIVVKVANSEQLSAEESLRHERFMRWIFISWEGEYLDFRSGLSDWINTNGYASAFRDHPKLRSEWDKIKDRRNPEFVEFLEQNVLVE